MNNNSKRRLFIAVPLSSQVRSSIDAWCQDNQDTLAFNKWVHPEDYHITVQFLGDTDSSKVGDIGSLMREAVLGITPFSLEASGCGTFGRPALPSILWAGVKGDLDALHQLQHRVVQANQSLGYVPEDRPYRPHISIARKHHMDKTLTQELLKAAPTFGSWTVDKLVLFRTRMHESPMYEVVEQVSL